MRQAGFGGIYYAARHDPTLGSRSIALFGKATDRQPDDPLSEWEGEATATTEPIPSSLVDVLRDTYGFDVLGPGTSL